MPYLANVFQTHLHFPILLLKLNKKKSILLLVPVFINCWMSCKQYRTWSVAAFYDIRYMSTQFGQACLTLDRIGIQLWIWATHNKTTINTTCATNEDSGQPAHPHSLIRVFAVRMCLLQPPSYTKMNEEEPLPYWGDVQTDLNCCWSHWSYCRFCRALAQLLWIFYQCILMFEVFIIQLRSQDEWFWQIWLSWCGIFTPMQFCNQFWITIFSQRRNRKKQK